MKQIRKRTTTPGCVATLQVRVIIDKEAVWKGIRCPLSSSIDADYCGEWCAWYDEDPEDHSVGWGPVATCQGKPIGVIIAGGNP